MLYIIGLGLEGDLSLRAIGIAKKCDCYYENYTSVCNLNGLKKILSKEVKILERKNLEDDLQELLDLSKKNNIAIFIPGDPLAATTHINILLEAKKQGIPCKIFHNSSIFTAIGETGLQLYKFGKTTTIPLSGQLQNVKDAVGRNKKNEYHTLLLLDIDPILGCMTAKQGIKILVENGIINHKEKIIAGHFGKESQIFYNRPKNLMEKIIKVPCVLILPGKLHFKEREFLGLLDS